MNFSFDQILIQLKAAQGNPEALTLAILDIVLTAHDPRLRPLMEVASIPHWFDHATLAALLPEMPLSDVQFNALIALPMIEPFLTKQSWNVHESTRLALRNRLAMEQPERLRQLSARAVTHFQEQPDAEVEVLYHRLLAEPDTAAQQIGAACYTFLQDDSQQTKRERLGLALAELLTLPLLPTAAEARACLHVVEIRGAYLDISKREYLAQRALNLFQTLAVADGEMGAWCVLGDIRTSSGQLQDAIKTYQQAQDILCSQLLPQHPTELRWQHNLADVYIKLGDIWTVQGQLNDAFQFFNKAHFIMNRLVKFNPDNTGWQHCLAIACLRLNDIRHEKSKFNKINQTYTEYQSILKQLAKLDPASMGWQRSFIKSNKIFNCMWVSHGQLDLITKKIKKCQEILIELTKLDPANVSWQHNLAIAYSKFGDTQINQGLFDVAAQAFKKDLTISTWLVTLNQANTSWQYDQAIALAKLGQCNFYMRKPKAGVLLLRKAEAQLSQLVQQSPDHAEWRAALQIIRQDLRQLSPSPGKSKPKPKRR